MTYPGTWDAVVGMRNHRDELAEARAEIERLKRVHLELIRHQGEAVRRADTSDIDRDRLRAGIEALEKEWRGNADTAGFMLLSASTMYWCADQLKALLEWGKCE